MQAEGDWWQAIRADMRPHTEPGKQDEAWWGFSWFEEKYMQQTRVNKDVWNVWITVTQIIISTSAHE